MISLPMFIHMETNVATVSSKQSFFSSFHMRISCVSEGTLDMRFSRSRNAMPRENSTSRASPPPGYTRTEPGFEPYPEEDEVQYANTSALGMGGVPYEDTHSPRQGPPRIPSPPSSYAVAHSYGPTANTSFGGSRPPQPMPRTCPRQGPNRSSPSTEGSEQSYPTTGHYIPPKSPLSEGSYNAHAPKTRDLTGAEYHGSPSLGGAKHPHNIPAQGFILPLSDRMSPQMAGVGAAGKDPGSPVDSLSDASHMGRYSPSQKTSSPASTEARSSPLSHDHYSRSQDDDVDSSDFDEELPCINPYAIMDLENSRTGGGSVQPYTVTDIPRLTDYPPSEHSS